MKGNQAYGLTNPYTNDLASSCGYLKSKINTNCLYGTYVLIWSITFVWKTHEHIKHYKRNNSLLNTFCLLISSGNLSFSCLFFSLVTVLSNEISVLNLETAFLIISGERNFRNVRRKNIRNKAEVLLHYTLASDKVMYWEIPQK